MTLMQFDRVISGDSHVREPVDLWSKTLAKKLGNRVPRYLGEHEGKAGSFFFTGQRVSKYGVSSSETEASPDEKLITQSGYDPVVRLDFQKRAGISAEVLYPSLALAIMAAKDAEVAQLSCQVYNDWITDFCSADMTRLIGTSAIPVHDVDWAVAELTRTSARGLRGCIVNVTPPQGARSYTDPSYDKLWAACQDLDQPVILHIITGQKIDPLVYFHEDAQYAQAPRHMFAVWNEIQETLSNDFIFGGILDRFPKLKILCGEYELSWLPNFMYRMDQMQDDFGDYVKLKPLKHKASDYMKSRIFHGMVDDPHAMIGFDAVGYDQVLWGSDFPHVRSIGIETQSRLAELMKDIPADARSKIVADNARRLFKL